MGPEYVVPVPKQSGPRNRSTSLLHPEIYWYTVQLVTWAYCAWSVTIKAAVFWFSFSFQAVFREHIAIVETKGDQSILRASWTIRWNYEKVFLDIAATWSLSKNREFWNSQEFCTSPKWLAAELFKALPLPNHIYTSLQVWEVGCVTGPIYKGVSSDGTQEESFFVLWHPFFGISFSPRSLSCWPIPGPKNMTLPCHLGI